MNPFSIIKTSILRPSSDSNWKNEVPRTMKLRAPRIWNMAYVVTQRILKDSENYPKSIVVSTALGALDETKNYLDGVFKDGFGSPRSFMTSVHNSIAGKIGIDFKIKGPNLTLCDGQNSFASSLVAASLFTKDDFPVLLIAIDEKIELFNTILPHLSDTCREYMDLNWEEAAVAFLLDPFYENKKPTILAKGPQLVYSQSPEQKCKDLAQRISKEFISLPLTETSNSFLKPAIVTYEMIESRKRGNYIIGSFSPSAQAVASIALCI